MKPNKRNAPYKRGNPSNKALNRPVDFRGLRVLARHDHGDVAMITVALSASDLILAGIAVNDALVLHAMSPGATIARPIIQHDGAPALILRVQAPPLGLKVDRLVNVSAVFRLDATFAEPAIEAVVSTIRVRATIGGGPITLPAVGTGPSLTDQDVGLKPNPGEQARAEAFIKASIGYRLHVEAKARDTARMAAVHVELDNDALHVAHIVDAGINRELIRLASRPGRDRKTGAAA
jgi:hypothetical protein